MGKKYTTDEIEVGGHMLDASMMSGLNTIVSAGSHTLAGYLTTYTDTTYSVGNGGLTEINFTSALNTKLAGITAGANNYVLPFTNNSANWNTAYGWGNHASAGYSGYNFGASDLTFEGTNPGDIVWRNGVGSEVHRIWSGTNNYLTYRNNAGTAYGIIHEGFTGYNNTNWDTAYGWGNHADEGYLTTYTDTNTTYDNTDFVDLTSNQTVGGIKTFTSDMVIKNGDPTLGFADTDANNDDFYIHVNSNNFYVLADRDDSGLNNGITGWDGAHPLQLEADTNKAYTFGNEIYHTGNLPGKAADSELLDGIDSTSFLRSDQDYETSNGRLTMNGGIGFPASNGGTYSRGSDSYGIYQESGAWSSPYPDLNIGFHTGISIGAHPSYGGVRFFTNSDMITQIMSVGNGNDGMGSGYVYVNEGLEAGSSLRAPVFYDSNDTGYYVNPNSDSNLYRGKFRANDQADNDYTLAALWTQNYNSGPAGIAFHISENVGKLLEMRTDGILYWNNSEVLTKSSGYLPLTGGTLTGDITVGSGQTSSNIYMADSDGTARRIHTNSNRIGFLTSGNGWGSYCSNNGDWTTDMISYAGASMRAPIFYDSNNTGYYLNPASTSLMNRLELDSDLDMRAQAGTWVTSNVMSDAIGWNASYGVYIGSNIGGTHYLRGNGTFTTDGSTYNLYHTGNFTPSNYLLTTGKAADSNLLDGIDSNRFVYGGANRQSNQVSTFAGINEGSGFYYGSNIANAPTTDWVNYIHSAGNSWYANNNYSFQLTHAFHTDNLWVSRTTNGSQSAARLILDSGSLHQTKQGTLQSNSDVRAPLFYDSNNTIYYLDPAGTSVQANIQAEYIGAGTGAYTSGGYRLNMGGSIRMNNGSIDYLSQLHFNDNVRFYDDGNDSYLNFKYGDATTGGIKFLNGGGTLKGYVFANAESFGLLDAGGNWAVKTAVGTAPLTLSSNSNPEFYVYDSYTVSPGSSRAPIFYDYNNTGYYLDPTSTSVLSNLILKTTSGSTRIEIESASNWSYCRYKNGASVRFDTGVNQNGNYEIRPYGASSNRTYFDYSGNSFSEASKRAPMFYDSNNTGFYLNPAGTSLMNSVVFTGNSTPIVSKYSNKKSWVQHITDNAYIFAPSTAINGTTWDWPNQTRLSSDGTVTAKNFILSSDERLKTKIVDLSCDNIDVNWKSFEMTSSEGEYRTGVIAQELEQKHPEFVNTDNEGFKSVKYIDLLIAKIAELEARLEKLEK